ncbi:hypothetical protein KXW98_005601 [Aspergillus fumigatus]|nr:hypothetical protein KXX11_008367 [Aspergillus fumigatus]KAH1337714.1 hypothetical protein KXX67_001327 [Aspergillus fumigatus]KAH1344007.1 hypothetical protein KXX14_005434 [Aspergillus fumigatus]KAH1351502.1 hypothetical protein KXX33_009486 [Aspergillus fumigatus]KAH1366450.1 hypothetical protein KXX63_002929 [Aspergillus fumigatus]
MGKDNFIRQVENSAEFKLLDKVVKDQVTVQDAVQEVIDMTMTALSVHGPSKQGGIGVPDYNISLAVMELAQRREPAEHTKLAKFVSHLQKQIAIDPSTNEPLTVQRDILWTDMPSFGYTELETWSEFGGDYKDPCDITLASEQRDRWTKLNAFLAQLTQAADIHYPPPGEEVRFFPLDKSLRAIWVMAMAFENERPPSSLGDTAAMEAACLWFIYAAKRLWANVVNNRTYPAVAGAGPGKRYEAAGWTGYTRERWGIWEDALKEARAACKIERMRVLINNALAIANVAQRLADRHARYSKRMHCMDDRTDCSSDVLLLLPLSSTFGTLFSQINSTQDVHLTEPACTVTNSLPAATCAIYTVLAIPILYLLVRHGRDGLLGWLFLFFFCTLRIIGGALAVNSPSTAATVISSVGLSPVLLATAGTLQEA